MSADSVEILISLANEHWNQMCGYAMRFGFSEQAAEDAIQSVLLGLIQNPDSIRVSSPYPYLLVAIMRECGHRDRRDSKRLRNERSRFQEERRGVLDSPSVLAELGEVREFVERLPQPYRSVVKMKFCDGYKNSEIAGKLRIDLSTMRSQLRTAAELLRGMMQERAGS